jgi:hypothetical protein
MFQGDISDDENSSFVEKSAGTNGGTKSHEDGAFLHDTDDRAIVEQISRLSVSRQGGIVKELFQRGRKTNDKTERSLCEHWLVAIQDSEHIPLSLVHSSIPKKTRREILKVLLEEMSVTAIGKLLSHIDGIAAPLVANMNEEGT